MPPQVSRRDFLNAAAGVGGGLILTLTVPGFGGQTKPGKPAGGGQLNAWLVIGADESVTVIVDRSEMGQGVYTALPMLLAEELEISLDAIKIVAAPVGDAYINPLNGGQITGTSNSVQDAWEKLRTAGAQARTMLILAAARRWKLEPADCQAKNGRIVSTRGNTLTYGQLAAAAAQQPVPQQVKLKPKGNFQLIGTSQARTDIPGKVDGTAQFGIDVTLPGMIYAALAQSPVLGGKVRSVDSAAAQAMPGVRKVLTTDSGVVVVAEHYWQALQARKALDITWDPGTNAQLDNAAIRALLDKAAAASSGLVARSDGNLAAAFKSAQHVLIAVYRLPLLAHATMEPMNCTADVKADGCDLYVGTQVQQISQAAAASAAGLAPAQVRVHTTLLGGGFGRRLEVDYIPAAVQASNAVAAPVKLIWTREDDMTHDLYRPPAREELSAGLDAGGNIVAWRLHVTSPSITSRFAPQGTDPFDSVLEAAVNNLYGVPNILVSYSRQEIGIDVGYMRSVSHAANCFAIESFMDELAGVAGQNPYDFRQKALHLKPRAANVLRLAAQRAGWGRPPQGRYQGIALLEAYATNMSMVAEVSIADEAVKVHKIVCVVDCGQMINPRIVESQIESGIIFGLTAALWGEVTVAAGRVQQTNFNNYRMLRAGESPEIDVHLVPSDEAPGGIGEPAAAMVAPAVCNAIFAATGQRLRELPISAFKLRPGAERA